MNMQLAFAFFESKLGPLAEIPPQPLSPWEFIEAIWPLNDVFRPHIHQIRSIAYDPGFEPGADAAIEDFALRPVAETWAEQHPGIWRVLLERQQQVLEVALLNDAAGKDSFTFIPAGLPDQYRMPGLMLLWLHSMKLRWPAGDRSQIELAEGAAPESLRRN